MKISVTAPALCALLLVAPAIADESCAPCAPRDVVLQMADIPLTPVEWERVGDRMTQEQCDAAKDREQEAWRRYGHLGKDRLFRCIHQ